MGVDMTDPGKIDLLLQYILSVAGQEDYEDRELGMIHLIKYAYLADLAYSEHHNGETFTGAPWRFHHYGPWAEVVYSRIEPALSAVHARKRAFHSTKYDKDLSRWSIDDDELHDALERRIDLGVAGAVQKYVHKFGTDTTALLHHVYKTPPMLRAAPDEYLDFSIMDRGRVGQYFDTGALPAETLTVRQKKKRKEKFVQLKKGLNHRLDKELKKSKRRPKPPRYDEVYAEGVRHLDELAGSPLESLECTALFTDEVWKSKARFDPDVP